ncbi:MAG: TraB/GumN family protein [Nitrospirales bacterium]|jgi:uncharacterized protein YbaP (TraB family)
MLTHWLRQIATLCVVGLVWGGGPAALVVAQESTVPPAHHILWKVQSSQNTIFLLGSIHVLRENNYPLGAPLYEAFEQASTVIFEVDLDELSSPVSQLQMLKKGLYSNGQNLQSVLSKESYQTAKADFASLGLDIKNFHPMKPWMAATAVMALEMQKLGYDSAYGVDRHFFTKAQKAGKEIKGLETVEFQLGLFDNLSGQMQEFFLLQSLEDLKDIEVRIKEMVDAWTQGNVKDLEGILEGMREYPELFQALVVSRNQKWIPQIEQALQQPEPAFIVVGALHLLGKEGLVAALQDKGYSVEQW